MTMRAVQVTDFGGPEVFQVVDGVDDPVLGPDSVLVRVQATSVNPVDYKIATGALQAILPTYLPMVPGWDVAGVVERVGPAVTEYAEGQRVLGYARKDYVQHGTWAQRAAVPVRCLAPLADGVEMGAASCLPLSGLTAWQCLDAVGVGAGDTVLVHAATGGVGHLAVQLATARGARVIGSASPANAEFLRSLGGEPVDHTADVASQVRALAPDGVDAVVDLHSAETLTASLGLLQDPSRFVTVTAADVAHQRGGHYVFVRPDTTTLQQLAERASTGSLTPVVSGQHPLSGVRDAVEQSMAGVRGKVVLDVAE